MIRAHAKAIIGQLELDDLLATCTFEGVVTDRPNKYATIYLNSGVRTQERFTGPQSTAYFDLTVHSVGYTAEQAQIVAERVFAQLLGFTPTVTGRSCRRLRHVSSLPIALDTSISPPLYYTADVFELTSDPA